MKSPLQKHMENLEKDKSPKPKVIGTYLHPKYNVLIKVYEGVKDVPFKSLPVGGGE